MNIMLAQIPMVRLVIPFLAGILLALCIDISINNIIFTTFVLSSLVFLISVNFLYKTSYQNRWIFGATVAFLLIILGIKTIEVHNQLNDKNHFSYLHSNQGQAIIKVTESVTEKNNSFQLNGNVIYIIGQDSTYSTIGKIVIYLEKDSLASKIRYGDIIITEFNFNETQPPSNPNQFNYKKFLANNNIFHQAYRRSGEWYNTGINKGNWLLSNANSLRDNALSILEKNNVNGKEYAVASALVLGYKENLDEELQKGFAGAGAMHVLCVSGLHVGIIFMVLNIVLGFLKRIKRGNIIKTLLIISLIWLYAAITGFSPSVQRATTMFTFVAISHSFSHKTNIYNTLAASALFLMVIDSYIITKIGFQLSYIAVVGIVSMQPLIYKKFVFKYTILDKAWGIISVSIAAQLATGPLGLYYFNQFPNYFILTNLIVIPLSSIIIYLALSVIAFSSISIISEFLGELLSYLVMIMHKSVVWIEALPGSVSSNIYISTPEMFLIFIIITSVSTTMLLTKKKMLITSLILILIILISFSFRDIQNSKNKQIIVYNINNETAIDIISGKNNLFIASEFIVENPQRADFHTRENRLKNGIINNTSALDINQKKTIFTDDWAIVDNLLEFNNHKFYFLNKSNQKSIFKANFKIDYLIVSQNPRVIPSEIIIKYNPKKIIIDSSNSYYNIKLWKEECEKSGLEYWSVRESGAFIKTFN
jgi:competence protein ComEC